MTRADASLPPGSTERRLPTVSPVAPSLTPLDGIEAAALVAAIAGSQDRQAFARLFGFYAPRLKSFLLKQGFAASECDDLIQDTMLTVWRKAASFDTSRGAVSTWIFTICRNLGIDRRRQQARHFTEELDLAGEREDPAPSAEGQVLTQEAEARVRDALQHLSPEQARVITLSFYSQTPQTAIAEALGIPLGTVKSRVRLAIGRLRQLLEDLSP